jgi:hypothetical protein
MTLLLKVEHPVKLSITPSIELITLLLRQHKSILMLDSSPLLIPKAVQSLPLLLQTFTLQLHMFCMILLGHLCTRECRSLPTKYNRLERNHHLVNLSFMEDHHSMVGLPLLGDNPIFMFFPVSNLPLPVIPRSLIHHWPGENFVCWKPFTIPGSIFWRHIYPTPCWGALLS